MQRPQRIIWSWYTGRWCVGCYIWYSEERTGWGRSSSRPLLTVPTVPTVRCSAVSMCPIKSKIFKDRDPTDVSLTEKTVPKSNNFDFKLFDVKLYFQKSHHRFISFFTHFRCQCMLWNTENVCFDGAAGWLTTCSVRDWLLISSHQSVDSAAAAAAVTMLSAKDAADKSTRRRLAAGAPRPLARSPMIRQWIHSAWRLWFNFFAKTTPTAAAESRSGRAGPGER